MNIKEKLKKLREEMLFAKKQEDLLLFAFCINDLDSIISDMSIGVISKASFAQVEELLKERGITILCVDDLPKSDLVNKLIDSFSSEELRKRTIEIAAIPELIINDVKEEKYSSQPWKPKHKRK